jgi:positive regulator of sigma E activity
MGLSFIKAQYLLYLLLQVWATVSLLIAVDMGLQSTFALIIFVLMTLMVWILIPCYVRKVRHSYIFGTILLVAGLAGLFASAR